MSKPKAISPVGRKTVKRAASPADSEQHLRLILESARDFAIFTTDCDGVVTSWNIGAERMFHFKEREIVGKDGRVLWTTEDQASGAADRELATAVKKGRAEDDRWHMRKDGTRFWGSGLAMALRDGKQKVCGVLKLMRDLTERKRADDALERTTKRLRIARDSLEKRVTERTRKYREANAKLREQIVERKRLERVALESAEREQRRIGQDLHDTLCQQLAGLALMTRTLASRIGQQDAGTAKELGEIGDMMRQAADELRRVSSGLYPVEFERHGIMGALRKLCEDSKIGRRNSRFICPEPVMFANPATALHLFRIAQECVTNALKHSGAKSITVSLLRDGCITLKVVDDGQGFDPSVTPPRSMGLEMMRHRAQALEADLRIDSVLGEGTAVTCMLPLAVEAATSVEVAQSGRAAGARGRLKGKAATAAAAKRLAKSESAESRSARKR